MKLPKLLGERLSLRTNFLLTYILAVVLSLNAQNFPHNPVQSKVQSQNASADSETIVVTGTFIPVQETEIDRSVTVLETEGQELLYQNWSEYLQLSPSVDFQQRAPNDVQGDLSIRGSTFGQTLVLIDGLRMNDVQTGHHDMDLPLPTDAVKRIEILRGAGSTLYGSDAMAGTINLITIPPQRSDVRIGAGLGNFGLNEESGAASLLWNILDTEFDVERDFSTGFRADRDYRNLSLFSNTGVQTLFGRTQVILGYGDKPYGADQFYGPFNSWERTKSWFTALKQDFGKKTEFDFAFRRHTDQFVLFRNQPSIFENNHIDKSWQTDLRHRENLSQNASLFFGAEGVFESITSNNLGDHDRSRGAVYADYDVRSLKRFSFSAGAREEILSTAHGTLSPTLAAGVWLKPTLKLKGSAGRAFRLPSYTDLYYHDPANFGNPNLKPEQAWDFEGGLLWNPGSRFKSEVTIFERRDHNVIDYVRASSSSPYVAENIHNLNFTGVEASIEVGLPRNERFQISYTGLHGVEDTLGSLQTKYTFNYPKHDAVVAWNGSLPCKFVARMRVGAVDRYSGNPYGLWDAAVAHEFRHFAAHLILSNITDTQYYEIPGVLMPGRTVVAGVDLFWRTRNH